VRRAITATNPFKWRHYPGDVILWCVRWYLRFPISFAHMAEMALERGLLIHSSCRMVKESDLYEIQGRWQQRTTWP
jgi:IS6 family transposase